MTTRMRLVSVFLFAFGAALLLGRDAGAQIKLAGNTVVTGRAPNANLTLALGKIDCPLAEARTEITTAIPAPWWQTPQIGKLTRTKVDRIGGELTLCCGYWAYGTTVWVMHKMPTGVSGCKAQPTGFVCR